MWRRGVWNSRCVCVYAYMYVNVLRYIYIGGKLLMDHVKERCAGLNVCMNLCIGLHTCKYACACVYVQRWTKIYTHTYIHTYIHTYTIKLMHLFLHFERCWKVEFGQMIHTHTHMYTYLHTCTIKLMRMFTFSKHMFAFYVCVHRRRLTLRLRLIHKLIRMFLHFQGCLKVEFTQGYIHTHAFTYLHTCTTILIHTCTYMHNDTNSYMILITILIHIFYIFRAAGK